MFADGALQVATSPAPSLSELHSNLLSCIIAFLDWPSRLAFSLCCRRICTVVFDPVAWPRLVLGPQAADESFSLVRRIYAKKRTALIHLKLRHAKVTTEFFDRLNEFLGEENSISILKVRDCRNIERLELAFPRATHIMVLDTPPSFTFGEVNCPMLTCLDAPGPLLHPHTLLSVYPTLQRIQFARCHILRVRSLKQVDYLIYLRRWDTITMGEVRRKIAKKSAVH